MALDRDQIKAPVLRKKEVPFDPLGGDVIVRGLFLAEQLANTARQAAEREARAGETEREAMARANGFMVIRLLSQAVITPAGEPLMSAEGWEALSVEHPAELFALADVVLELSGGGGAAEKN